VAGGGSGGIEQEKSFARSDFELNWVVIAEQFRQVDGCGLVVRRRINEVGRYVDRVSSAGHFGSVGFRGFLYGKMPVRSSGAGEISPCEARPCDQLGSAASPGLVMGTPMILP
jgi:hypothetical protein